MTKEAMEQFAEMLDEREYRSELSDEEIERAERLGLLVVFGASDDLLEFRGSINDEVGCYNGGTVDVCASGLVPVWGDGEEKDYDSAKAFFNLANKPTFSINAEWDPDDEDLSWAISISVKDSDGGGPRYCPFLIMEDGEKYCKGLVIDFESWAIAQRAT